MKKILIILAVIFFQSGAVLFGQGFSEGLIFCGAENLPQNIGDSVFRKSISYLMTDSVILRIPVVFHVDHDGEESSIKKSEILTYLSKLNERFRRWNADTINAPVPFLPFAADTKIEFVLAKIDPEGNCTDGIIRNPENSYWPPNKYLNIYISRRTISRQSFFYFQIVGGSATPPIAQLPLFNPRDAVFITYGGLEGLTLTHEVGHWFGLNHLWSPASFSGTPNTDCTQDDYVEDTPLQANPTPGCPVFPYYTCDTILGNMFSNYMDYSTCINMFTAGQRDRMWAILNSDIAGRSNLWTTQNLIETGALDDSTLYWCDSKPKADFGFGKYTNYWCYPAQIPFWDASYKGEPTEWQWIFEGGDPLTSNEQNPLVRYEVSGDYHVTFIASNSHGSDTISRVVRITSIPETPHYLPSELIEDFENENLNFNDFYLFHDTWRKWELTPIASHSGQHAISLMIKDSLNGYPATNYNGDRSAFFTPQYDISQLENGNLSFYFAGSSYLANSADDFSKLGVFASINCGDIQSLIQFPHEFYWDSLTTYTGYESPLPGDWKKMTIQIPDEVFNYDKVSFVFRYKSDFRNNNSHPFTRLFVDDIEIESNGPVSVQHISPAKDWKIYPNPSDGSGFKISGEESGQIRIFDINGNLLSSHFIEREKEFSQTGMSNGTYFVSFTTNSFSETKMLVVLK